MYYIKLICKNMFIGWWPPFQNPSSISMDIILQSWFKQCQ